MRVTRPIPVGSPARSPSSPAFDKFSFVKFMKNVGILHRNQAMELVSICRTFVQEQDQSFNPDADRSLRAALQAVDDALMSAAEKSSKDVDKKFERATEVSHSYGMDWHSRCPNRSEFLAVNERMAAAKTKDGKISSTLIKLKNKTVRFKEVTQERFRVVEFLLMKSLTDRSPTIVRQVLSEHPNLTEVLWNFSRFRDPKTRLTLKHNPHFYKHLPRLPEGYAKNFRCDPIEDFRHRKIYVLTDRPSRIYLEAGQVSRAFGNVWCPQNALIFKDVCGKLEGEEIVGSYIKEKSSLRCCVERPPSPTLPDSVDWWPLQDWRDPIRRSLRSPGLDVGNIRIFNCAIDSVNDDVLLRIFGSYRLDDDEKWNLQLRWYKLIHVCRRWRHLILGSPSHLNLHLLCTNGTPVADMLNNSPALPIIINYQNVCATVTRKDEEGVLLALQHRDRVRHVVLHAPFEVLDRLLPAMNRCFPTLERVFIYPTTNGYVRLVLLGRFQAPRLSHLSLFGVTLTMEPRSLASTVSLVVLKLINPWYYLPPEDLAAQLQFVPLLEELSIIFSNSIHQSSIQKHAMYTPITHANLLVLKLFIFRGSIAYLEGLLARITTPCLRNFDVKLFNEHPFNLPVLSQFISSAAEPRFPSANVNFNQDFMCISLCNHNKSFYVRVSCRPFDWQVRSVAQICSALGRTLSGVEVLSLDFYEHGMPLEWRNKVDSRTWSELLRPFKSVEKLCVGHALALDLSRTLQPEEEPSEPLLPVLKELDVEEGCEDNAFTAFIDARLRPDCPIQLVVCPSTRNPDLGAPPLPDPIQKQEKPWNTKYLTNGLQSIVPS